MVGLRPSEAPVGIYQSTRRNIPEDINFSSLVPSKLIPTKTESHFANPITTDFNDKQLTSSLQCTLNYPDQWWEGGAQIIDTLIIQNTYFIEP